MKFTLYTFCKIFLFILFFSSFKLQAQQHDKQEIIEQLYQDAITPNGYIRCGTSPIELLRNKGNYTNSKLAFEDYIKEQLQPLALKKSAQATIFEIPVIFHIIHNGEEVGSGDNLAFELIQAQLEQLNNDFRKITGTSGDGGGVDTEIQFSLALLDEDGNLLPESGVRRINRNSIDGLGNPPFTEITYNNIIKPSTQFDPNQYLNIWVGGSLRFSLGGRLLGIAQFPEAPSLPGIDIGDDPPNTDGVVVRTSSVGSTTLVNPDPNAAPFDKGRTLTHEIGHWLGLRHTGGDGDCTADDFCADTPTAFGNQVGCSETSDSCPTVGLDPIENYMNFTNDDCMERFTACQRDRMRIVMGATGNGSPRREILASSTVDEISQGFDIVTLQTSYNACVPNDIIVDFRVEIASNFSGNINFTTTNLPQQLSTSFSNNSVNTSGIYTLTISNTANISPTDFTINIVGADTNSSFTSSTSTLIQVQDAITNVPNLLLPTNGSTNQPRVLNLNWESLDGTESYDIQVASDISFNTIFESENDIMTTSFQTAILSGDTTFFWRVRGNNACGSAGPWSDAFSFTTVVPTTETGTCTDPIEIQCGTLVAGDLINGQSTIDSYGQFFSGLTGREQIYSIQLSEPSIVEVTLSNLSANADLIIFADCDNPTAIESGFFRPGLNDETATANLDAQNTYYIAIEGRDDTVSTLEFTLAVTCTPLCSSSSGIVETFENGEPTDWTFTVSGTGDSNLRRWRFDDSIFRVGVSNPGSGDWARFDDFEIAPRNNNTATATTPTVNLSDQENIRLFFDFSFAAFAFTDFTRLSVTDGTKTYYWSRNLQNWTTTLSTWLDDNNTSFAFDTDAVFNQTIPTDLDTSSLSVTIFYDDGSSPTLTGLGFGFDNFSLCGESITPPTDTKPVVEFTTPADGDVLNVGDDLPVIVSATDDGSIANVRLFLNGIFVRQENVVPYEWAAPGQQDDILRNLDSGSYTLRAVATDNNGNTGENTITIIVENTNNIVGNFDFGTPTSPLENGFTRVDPSIISGSFRWTNNDRLNSRSRNRASGVPVTNLNRDFIFARVPRTFEVDVPNGTYNVIVTFGDRRRAHDNQQVDAENGQVIRSDIDTSFGEFEDQTFEVTVTDGALSLEFSDAGGSNPDWAVTRVSFTQTSSVTNSETGTTRAQELTDMVIIQNPVSDMLTIEKLPKGEYNAILYSLKGTEIMRKNIKTESSQYRVELPSLSTGIYILRISSKDFIFNRKIVVDHR